MPKENIFPLHPEKLDEGHDAPEDPLNPDIDIEQLLAEGRAIDLSKSIENAYFEKPEPGRYAELKEISSAALAKHEAEKEAYRLEREAAKIENVERKDGGDISKAA